MAYISGIFDGFFKAGLVPLTRRLPPELGARPRTPLGARLGDRLGARDFARVCSGSTRGLAQADSARGSVCDSPFDSALDLTQAQCATQGLARSSAQLGSGHGTVSTRLDLTQDSTSLEAQLGPDPGSIRFGLVSGALLGSARSWTRLGSKICSALLEVWFGSVQVSDRLELGSRLGTQLGSVLFEARIGISARESARCGRLVTRLGLALGLVQALGLAQL